MYAKQRKLQYHPDKERVSPATYNLDTVTDVELVTADGETVHGWYARPKDPEKPVIVYFHGNAEAVQTRWERARLFTDEE